MCNRGRALLIVLCHALLATSLVSCANNPAAESRQRADAWAEKIHASVFYDVARFKEITDPNPLAIAQLFLGWTAVNDDDLRELAEIKPVVYAIDLPSKANNVSAHETHGKLPGVLTDRGMGYLAQLQELRYLGVNDNAITDAGVAQLSRLPNLVSLGLAETEITDDGLASLKSLSKLKILDIHNTNITGTGLVPLADNNIPLEELLAINTKITDQAGVVLGKFSMLTKLWLDRTQVGDESVRALAGLKNLKILSLHNTQVTDASIPTLEKMTWLEYLGVSGTKITPQGLKRLYKLPPDANEK